MDLFSLTIIILVVGFLSAYIDRRRQARLRDKSSTTEEKETESLIARTTSQAQALSEQAQSSVQNLSEQAGKQAKAFGSQARSTAQSLRERIPAPRSKEDRAADFRAWALKATADEPELATWLASLNDSQFVDFTETVEDFCDSIGVDLSKLVQNEMKLLPELEENAREAVVNYCRSCQRAAAAQSELALFRAYQDYVEKPGSRRGRAYGQKLLDRLLEAKLTTVSLSDFLGAAPKDRDAHILQAVQTAAEKDPAGFSRVLQALAAEEETQPTPASVEPAPAAA